MLKRLVLVSYALFVMALVTGLTIVFERYFKADVSPIIISITVIGISVLWLLSDKNDCICINDPNEEEES